MRLGVFASFVGALLSTGFPNHADAFTLDWWTIDSGGAMWTASDSFELSGTIGQPDVGVVMTGGDFELAGGFWPGIPTAPTTCPGDSDCSGDVGFADIDLFVAAIPDNETAWAALYAARHGGNPPPCLFLNNDCTRDGHVSFADIDSFVALIPSTCP